MIRQILESKLVVSSSLHGIILAETYGVPAVLLSKGKLPGFKFIDWYHSTGRKNIVVAHSIEEAISIEPMDTPDLCDLQNGLISAFPTDLWNIKFENNDC